MNEDRNMSERPNLKFYLSPTLHVNPNMSVCTMMEAMFIGCISPRLDRHKQNESWQSKMEQNPRHALHSSTRAR
jgi:hypothetical protein